ncbi:MAG: NADH-quinone oxidoreductase subunit C [Rhodoferax sp.]|nr:NADH-quinone oxidoreductase subunit C [Rhodoferax sp.]
MMDLDLQRLPGAAPIWRGLVSADQWLSTAMAVRQGGGRLVAVWGVTAADRVAVSVAYAVLEGLLWLELVLSPPERVYPDLAGIFPAASRMQRALADLNGLQAASSLDSRPWLDHGLWLGARPPLLDEACNWAAGTPPGGYPFVRVQGDGVHEIAVGPVHAGIIEPGHFRFSVVGEKVLRLEQHLGYTHKGIERRFTQLDPLQAHRLAGRVSGDSTVAYAWAYCMALESACGVEVPARAAELRALMLERERVAAHLADLGALGNDAAFAFGLAQFSRLREDWLRRSGQVFGHRLMMDRIVPGGVASDIDTAQVDQLRQHGEAIAREVQALRVIYDEHAGLQDRFLTTGRVMPGLAAQLGLTGLAGRASGQAWDVRCDHAVPPYDRLQARMVTHRGGDVAARVIVRFEELAESLRLMQTLLESLTPGPVHTAVPLPPPAAFGAGWVEGWRGEVLVALELADAGQPQRIRRCHCHDPSWQNWPVLEHAVIGNIVPDFPLINKSFNLSYSGHDL